MLKICEPSYYNHIEHNIIFERMRQLITIIIVFSLSDPASAIHQISFISFQYWIHDCNGGGK